MVYRGEAQAEAATAERTTIKYKKEEENDFSFAKEQQSNMQQCVMHPTERKKG